MRENLTSGSRWQGMKTRYGDGTELSGNINSDKKAGEVKVVHCADEEALHT
jgi:hypothetical protein